MRRSPTERRRQEPARGAARAVATACGLAMMLVTWCARAQLPDAGAADDPDALITRGVDLRRHGDDQGALPLLRAAHERGGTPRAAAQLGFVEQALGMWVDAEAHLAAAAAATTDPWVGEHASLLAESLAFVRRHLGALVVESTVAGAEVSVDGVAVGRTPLPTPLTVATGPRRVEARAGGYRPFAATVTVRAGTTTRVAAAIDTRPSALPLAATAPPPVLIAPVPTATDTARMNAPPRPLYKRWWLWTGIAAVLIGASVALAVTGGPDPYPCGGNGRVCAR
jgi:PEGA domain